MDLKKNEHWNQVVDDFLLSRLIQV